MKNARERVSKRSAVRLTTFITRLKETGTTPASIELRPDGTLVAVFAKSDAAGLCLESRMEAMMK